MKTLYDKLWDEHHIHSFDNGYSLIYIDRHLIINYYYMSLIVGGRSLVKKMVL